MTSTRPDQESNLTPGWTVQDLRLALETLDPNAPVFVEMSGDSDFSTVRGLRGELSS